MQRQGWGRMERAWCGHCPTAWTSLRAWDRGRVSTPMPSRKGRTEVSSLDLENKYKISLIHITTISLPELTTEASSPHAS